MAKILIINGPNLNLLGIREPAIYGRVSMEDYLTALAEDYPAVELQYFQSNHEGEIIDRLHEDGFNADLNGIILNAGAYSHTSLAIADAVKAIERPVIEVHISNIAARESLRHTSLLTAACRGLISGFGLESYRLAIEALL
ncbi:MAG: type II 3-dehydroquinate dehydratase [Muribaculaceae bacterium]|nr:type II 3-dehydroquinate dehydratase [Muribaculaceae bacterium]